MKLISHNNGSFLDQGEEIAANTSICHCCGAYAGKNVGFLPFLGIGVALNDISTQSPTISAGLGQFEYEHIKLGEDVLTLKLSTLGDEAIV